MPRTAENLYERQTYTERFDLLLPNYASVVVALPIAPGQNTLKRGAVLYQDSTSLYKEATASEVVDGKALAILNEDCQTGAETQGVAPVAACILGGAVLRKHIAIKSAETVTAEKELVLRKQGIYLLHGLEADGSYDTVKNTVDA